MLEVAPDLLGATVRHLSPAGPVAVRLTEVEAYAGEADPGSHAFRGRTPRTAVMFGPPGRVYVYFTYGMHWCMNLVCGPEGEASAVLLRAGEVVEGADLAAARRTTAKSPRELARGPARLTVALGVDGRPGRRRRHRSAVSAHGAPAGRPGRARDPHRAAGRRRGRRRGPPVAVLARRRAQRVGVPAGGTRVAAGTRCIRQAGGVTDSATSSSTTCSGAA